LKRWHIAIAAMDRRTYFVNDPVKSLWTDDRSRYLHILLEALKISSFSFCPVNK